MMNSELKSNLLTFEKTTLSNGLRVVTSEMPFTMAVSINVYVGVGSRYETEEMAWISHFIEHLMFKGTNRRPTPFEISSAIEGTGGVINAGTEQELTVYWVKVGHAYFEESLDLLMDMLHNSLFEHQSVEKERMVVLEELNMITDYPNYRADALIDEMLWPKHPLGRDIGGTKDSISDITREMMLDHTSRYYVPSNIVVSVAGNVQHQQVVNQVEALTDGWCSGSPDVWSPFTDIQSTPQLRLEFRKTEQAHLVIAFPGLPLAHPDRFGLDILSVMLGEGMSSRLFVEIREKEGLAYDVHSGVSYFLDCGAFVITAGVEPRRIYTVVDKILAQLTNIREGVPKEELERAKRLISGRLMLRMEDTRAISAWMGNQEMLMKDIMQFDDVVESINRVSTEDIEKVASSILVEEKLNMAVVGPCRGGRRLEKLMKL